MTPAVPLRFPPTFTVITALLPVAGGTASGPGSASSGANDGWVGAGSRLSGALGSVDSASVVGGAVVLEVEVEVEAEVEVEVSGTVDSTAVLGGACVVVEVVVVVSSGTATNPALASVTPPASTVSGSVRATDSSSGSS